MEQLQLKKYTKEEIFDITGVKNDSHAARNIKNTLESWGYSFEYSRKGVIITRQPTTTIEKLKEILIRELDIDVQVNVYDFAQFFNRLSTDEDFQAMPWQERCDILKEDYSINIDKRTLQNWAKKLLDSGVLVKDTDSKVEWLTFRGSRMPADSMPAEFVKNYKLARKKKLQEYLAQGFPFGQAYKLTFKDLYQETEVVLYSCSTLALTAFDDKLSQETIEEINNLCDELSGEEPFDAVEEISVNVRTVKELRR